MNKLFSELGVGEEFKVSGSDATYRKIDLVKISCCKSINAEEVSSSNKTFFSPGTVVAVNG